MLQMLDSVLLIFHLLVIAFNLTGWIWRQTRGLHLISVAMTAGSWIFGGFFYGFGYCFLTDWQWQVKYQLGERNLPASFIKYGLDGLAGSDFDAALVDWFTGITFGIIVGITVFVNRKRFGQNPRDAG